MKYKIILFLVISVLSLVGCQSAQSQKIVSQQATPQKTVLQKTEWQAASIENIQIGKTNIKDIGNVFGHKLHQTFFKGENGTEVWHEYEVKLFDKWDGKLTLVTKDGIVTSAYFYPKSITKPEAMDFFGNDYIVSHYRFDESFNDESVPLIEDEKGNIETVEYRNKGIAIFSDSKNMVQQIEFLSQPIGEKSSQVNKNPQEK